MASSTEKIIGKGGYGVVHEVQLNGRTLARKTYNTVLCPSAIREAVFLTSTKHPNIIRLEAVDFTPTYSSIYLELATDRLYEYIGRGTDLLAVRKILHGIFCGLQVIHQQGLVHGDLTPFNILMVGDVPKIADFGSLQPPRRGAVTTNVAWSAPEFLLDRIHGFATDVWAVGLSIYEWLSGKEFWSTNIKIDDLLEQQTKLLGCSISGSLADFVPEAMKSRQPRLLNPMKHVIYSHISDEKKQLWNDLVNGCLTIDPSQRWSVDKILSSPLFSDLPRPIPEIMSSRQLIPRKPVTSVEQEAMAFIIKSLKGSFPDTTTCTEEVIRLLHEHNYRLCV